MKAPVFIVIYILSCKIVPSALPHFENKSLEMIFFLKKRYKEKKKEIKNNFPELTYKDWDFFYSWPSYLESQSTWTWKQRKKKKEKS